MTTCFQMLPEKDFAAEVRGFRDLEAFLKQAVIVLNLSAQNVRDIMAVMLGRLLGSQPKVKDQCSEAEVMSACFANESGTSGTVYIFILDMRFIKQD